MPALTKAQAVEKLAAVVEKAKPDHLAEIYSELFPEESADLLPAAKAIARHIRTGLEVEEVVDLWNVVFPGDRNVWYNEEEQAFHYNEEVVGYADPD